MSITAPELKRWLYRFISKYASEHELYREQVRDPEHYRTSAAALQRLAEHVQQLPDDDERLVRLAAAFPAHRQLADVGSPNLQTRCAGFGPGLYFGDDPDQFVSDYVENEIVALRKTYRP